MIHTGEPFGSFIFTYRTRPKRPTEWFVDVDGLQLWGQLIRASKGGPKRIGEQAREHAEEVLRRWGFI